MQHQGLHHCFNTLRAVCLDAPIPMGFMVGQFGRECSNIGHPTAESARTAVVLLVGAPMAWR